MDVNICRTPQQFVKSFQAARHALAVAAICIAAGFTIDFEGETDNTAKHDAGNRSNDG
jgi:hypothetical protein